MVRFSLSFSKIIFWTENFFFIAAFFVLEVCLSPLAYIKVWTNILRNSKGMYQLFCYSFLWAVLGLPIMMILIALDVYYLVKLFTYTNGCRYGQKDELGEEVIEAKDRV
jgi:hypothetical protein